VNIGKPLTLKDLQQQAWALLGFGREAQALVRVMKARWPHCSIHVFCEQEPAIPDDLAFQPHNGAAGHSDQVDQLHIGPFAADDLNAYSILVKSPGISPLHPGFSDLHDHIAVTSTTNLWFAERRDQRVIAITGSKGKSTTSALLHHVFRQSGVNSRLVGNIGLPLIEQLESHADWWVLELSSYQTHDLQAQVELGVVLSLFPDHLDWHGGERAYFRDKLKLLEHCERAWIPQDLHDDVLRWMPEWQSADVGPNLVGILTDEGIHPQTQGVMDGDRCLMPSSELPLMGAHNLRNVCVAWTLARYAGLDDEAIRVAIQSFEALPHRLQNIGTMGSHRFVDDSISTTPQASIAALRALAGQATTILVGGHDRGLDWREFAEYVQQHPPQAIITMGEHGRRILAMLEGCKGDQPSAKLTLDWAADLSDAVQKARQVSRLGSSILLSPGAPSYGEFQNFEARGAAFKAYAEETKKN